jgi:hypothetical protein
VTAFTVRLIRLALLPPGCRTYSVRAPPIKIWAPGPGTWQRPRHTTSAAASSTILTHNLRWGRSERLPFGNRDQGHAASTAILPAGHAGYPGLGHHHRPPQQLRCITAALRRHLLQDAVKAGFAAHIANGVHDSLASPAGKALEASVSRVLAIQRKQGS